LPQARHILSLLEVSVTCFKRIQQWTVDDHHTEHPGDVAWLEQQIFAIKKEDMENGRGRQRILFVTHHTPIRHRATRHYQQQQEEDSFFVGHSVVGLWAPHYITNIVQGTVKLVGS
jgi:hypothetical protein